jgi:hypothetical protein
VSAPQTKAVVQATQAGQYAVGGLRLKVSYHGHPRIMFAYDGIDVWFYSSGPVPSAADVVNGLNAAFGAQTKLSTAAISTNRRAPLWLCGAAVVPATITSHSQPLRG